MTPNSLLMKPRPRPNKKDILKAYLALLDHERHLENRAWSSLGHFITANAFLLAAWATLYVKLDPEAGVSPIALILLAISTMGYLGGLSWALLGARNWEYAREIVFALKALEPKAEQDPTASEVVPELAKIGETVIKRWGKKYPIAYQVAILSGGPLCISFLYILAIGVVLWPFVCQICASGFIAGVITAALLGGLITVAIRCRQSKIDAEEGDKNKTER